MRAAFDVDSRADIEKGAGTSADVVWLEARCMMPRPIGRAALRNDDLDRLISAGAVEVCVDCAGVRDNGRVTFEWGVAAAELVRKSLPRSRRFIKNAVDDCTSVEDGACDLRGECRGW